MFIKVKVIIVVHEIHMILIPPLPLATLASSLFLKYTSYFHLGPLYYQLLLPAIFLPAGHDSLSPTSWEAFFDHYYTSSPITPTQHFSPSNILYYYVLCCCLPSDAPD